MSAQSAIPTSTGIAFDVASIKPNKTNSPRSGSSMPPNGLFRGENLTIRQLIVRAYELRDFQVIGPDLINGDRFDVQARTPSGAPDNRMPEMLRALLAERFGLVVHIEEREQPIFELVLAREGRVDPALKPGECSGGAGCGFSTNTSNGSGTMTAVGRTMPELAQWVGSQVDRMVVDRTGLTGTYDFDVRFTRDDARALPPDAAPLLYTALQEQLGLKLEPARGPVPFVVIDRVSAPTPD
jgi:uncharacterized protein (TIGR03435 family)